MSLTFGFTASNSSGKQSLIFTKDTGIDWVYPTLVGEYNGNDIQIDFDGLDKEDLKDLISFMGMQLNKFKESE